MDDDELDNLEKKRPKDRYHCIYDVHVNSASIGIWLIKITICVIFILRNIKVNENAATASLIFYISTIILALFGYLCTQPKLYFPFIVLDILFKIIFGVFAFGLLLLGATMVEHFELLKRGYYEFPFWFCMFMVILFFFDVYALNIVCRSQRYLVRKLERSLHRMDAINPSTDSMHDSL